VPAFPPVPFFPDHDALVNDFAIEWRIFNHDSETFPRSAERRAMGAGSAGPDDLTTDPRWARIRLNRPPTSRCVPAAVAFPRTERFHP
jgi:hypothetical protein